MQRYFNSDLVEFKDQVDFILYRNGRSSIGHIGPWVVKLLKMLMKWNEYDKFEYLLREYKYISTLDGRISQEDRDYLFSKKINNKFYSPKYSNSFPNKMYKKYEHWDIHSLVVDSIRKSKDDKRWFILLLDVVIKNNYYGDVRHEKNIVHYLISNGDHSLLKYALKFKEINVNYSRREMGDGVKIGYVSNLELVSILDSSYSIKNLIFSKYNIKDVSNSWRITFDDITEFTKAGRIIEQNNTLAFKNYLRELITHPPFTSDKWYLGEMFSMLGMVNLNDDQNRMIKLLVEHIDKYLTLYKIDEGDVNLFKDYIRTFVTNNSIGNKYVVRMFALIAKRYSAKDLLMFLNDASFGSDLALVYSKIYVNALRRENISFRKDYTYANLAMLLFKNSESIEYWHRKVLLPNNGVLGAEYRVMAMTSLLHKATPLSIITNKDVMSGLGIPRIYMGDIGDAVINVESIRTCLKLGAKITNTQLLKIAVDNNNCELIDMLTDHHTPAEVAEIYLIGSE